MIRSLAVVALASTLSFGQAQPNSNKANSNKPASNDAPLGVVHLAAGSLSHADRAAGWRPLFNGTSSEGWRGYRQGKFPEKGWTIANGVLSSAAGGGGGDILTTEQFGDFELALEFKTAPKANSGVMYRVLEKHDTPWQTGPECQVIDDVGSGLEPTNPHSAGALYDLAPPVEGKVMKPAGEWNHLRIRLQNGVVQHWLNDKKVVECRMDDESWKARIAKSKFNVYEGFGLAEKGSIALQDHGDEVAYRNIFIRDLEAAMPGEVVLFNGTDTTGWDACVPDLAGKEPGPLSVWKIEDGILQTLGSPGGYIHTKADYTNYVLKLEWRFSPITKKAGNSGVLLRMHGDHKVWPKSVEAQLQSGAAGDFWNIESFPMKTEASRLNGRNTKATGNAERAIGEWNEYEIHVVHGRVRLFVNGELLNEAWEVAEVPGKICLQSEGAEIHFRKIRLAPVE